ncbi:Amidohydrolase [Planctomycetes bacterium Poly30]|uniref:Amidohydrolase n=1 Tax=Saltatorellus ferox TaxID=2528018 RepID=A0A518EKL1_9BACT|nr:Amidohydrolase [Planctomycetes bacterium Poly30]
MQVDAHQHFWSYDAADYPWIVDGGLDALRRDFLPEHLRPLLDAHGVQATIAVQACQTARETEWLLGLAADHPWIVGVVGWVDLAAGGVADEIARLRELPGGDRLVGVRHVIQDEPDGFMDAEPFRRGARELADLDLAYDLLIYERQAEEAIRFCEALDGQRIVLDHIGKPRIKDGALEPWGEEMKRFAALDHVSVKLSGMVTEADWSGWKLGDLEPFIEKTFEAFREERVMFGSDWPVCTLAADYGSVLRVAAPWTSNHGLRAAEAAYGPLRLPGTAT